MSADHITRDLAAKCAEDVAAAIKRVVALAETPKQAAHIALVGVAAATAVAGKICVLAGITDPSEIRSLTETAKKLGGVK